jgi:hypothetical protein
MLPPANPAATWANVQFVAPQRTLCQLSRELAVLTSRVSQLLQVEEQNNARQATPDGYGAPERLS